MEHRALREAMIATARRMNAAGLNQGTSGNLSVRVEGGFLLTPTGGTIFYDFPLGDTPDGAVSSGMGLRITAPATVNCRASMSFERA